MAATAKITLTVTQFNAIKDLSNANRFCIIDDPYIANGAGRVYTISGDRRTLRVTNGKTTRTGKAKAVNLEFTIEPANTYVIAGLLIDQAGFDEKGGGKNNFKLSKVDGSVVTVTDNYVDGKTYLEVLIGIQDITSGRIGIIDPGVENSEDA